MSISILDDEMEKLGRTFISNYYSMREVFGTWFSFNLALLTGSLDLLLLVFREPIGLPLFLDSLFL